MIESQFPCLLDYFCHQVSTRADSLALMGLHENRLLRFSWNELAAHVLGRAGELESLFESQPQLPRHAGYLSGNSVQDVITSLACPLAGAIEVPFDANIGNEAARIFRDQVDGHWLDHHQPFSKVDHPLPIDLVQLIAAKTQAIDIDSPALILWTSGTMSAPKGVVLSHRNLCLNAAAKLAAVPQVPSDVRLTSLPICHAYARTSDLGTWLQSGCALAIGRGYDAWKTIASKVQPTLANTVPSLSERLLASDRDAVGTSRLRLLGCGGAAMDAAAFDAWKNRGVTVIQGYGLTEASPVICSATPDSATAGLVGNFVDGWEAEIRDQRLFVRGPHLMQGYWNDPNETARRIQAGWLDTGDLVQIDPATGQVRILGRADDVIVLSNGYKVHPASIETRLQRLPSIRHAVIVGADRSIELWLDADETPGLITAVKNQLANLSTWQQPTAIRFFDTPLTGTELTAKGSIRRAEVMRRFS